MFSIKDIRYILLIVFLAGVGYMYVDWRETIRELKRVNKNQTQQIRLDSLKIAEVSFDKKEMEDYLTFENKDLKRKLINNDIKLNRIERIVSQKFRFKDTTSRLSSLSPMINNIRSGKPSKIPFEEKGKCFSIGGNIVYDGLDSLNLQINKRVYQDNLNNVTTWERKPHRWLFGIKTKIFGKKVGKVKVFNDCGVVETFIIDAKNKKVKN